MKLGETMESICEREYQDVNFLKLLSEFNGIYYPNNVYPNFILHVPTKYELKQWQENQGGES